MSKPTTAGQAVARALASAIAYGISVPLSKLLLAGVSSLWLSALLYLGAGAGAGMLLLVRKMSGRSQTSASLSRADLPTVVLMLVVNTASIICLMCGLALAGAASVSLLSNFEIVATAVFAWLLFGENIGRRFGVAIGLICLSSLILAFEGQDSLTLSAGSLLALAACALWGLENCCTKSLSSKDPLQVTCVKGLGTAAVSSVVALVVDGPAPIAPEYLIGSLALGFVSYGVSIALYISAQRDLGAARTGNYYAVAPFVGVALSWMVFGVAPDIRFFAALAIMALGTWLTLSEHHSHEHVHEAVTHEHVHDHLDGHHTHDHPGFDPSLKHSHVHTHERIVHTHEHTPDMNHAHAHSKM